MKRIGRYMFKAARLARIKEIILDRGQVDVNTLSVMLNVSDVTIRSDLEQLEQEKYIYRTYGGAVLNEDHLHQREVQENIIGANLEYDRDKEYVGQVAAELVDDGEWIFIGQGVTCYYVAKALLKKNNVNVVTNNLYAAGVLSQNRQSNVMMTGGSLAHGSMSLVGDMSLKFLDEIFISKAVIGVSGIDMDRGFTVSDATETNMFGQLKKISRELVVVADHTKFGQSSLMRIGALAGTVERVVTNDNIPEEYKSFFFEHGVKIYTSYKIKTSSIRREDA